MVYLPTFIIKNQVHVGNYTVHPMDPVMGMGFVDTDYFTMLQFRAHFLGQLTLRTPKE